MLESIEAKYLFWAIALGCLGSISLPMGSLLGLKWKPTPKIIAALISFGGGALIAALSVELVAPRAMHVADAAPAEHAGAVNHLLVLLLGALAGGGYLSCSRVQIEFCS